MSLKAGTLMETARAGINPTSRVLKKVVSFLTRPATIKPAKGMDIAAELRPAILRLSGIFRENIDIQFVSGLDNKSMEEICLVSKEAFTSSPHLSQLYLSILTNEKDFMGLLIRNNSGKLIGFALGSMSTLYSKTTYYLFSIAFTKQYRGHGIGKIILELLMLAAKQIGYRKALLHCAFRDIDGMNLSMYYEKALGFEFIRTCEDGFVLMGKEL